MPAGDSSDRVPDFLRPGIAALVEDLAAGRFDALERDGRAGRLTADEIAAALRDYGRTLVPLPAYAFDLGGDAVRVEWREPPEWSVEQDLWTREEGRSDLTLSLVARRDGERVLVEMTDLHVL